MKKEEILRLAARCGARSARQRAPTDYRAEIDAQAKTRRPKFPTAASGGDMHARPIPTGSFGDDYKPAAIGIEMPTLFVGPRAVRMERASELADRAGSVVQKAQNLVGAGRGGCVPPLGRGGGARSRSSNAPKEADDSPRRRKLH